MSQDLKRAVEKERRQLKAGKKKIEELKQTDAALEDGRTRHHVGRDRDAAKRRAQSVTALAGKSWKAR